MRRLSLLFFLASVTTLLILSYITLGNFNKPAVPIAQVSGEFTYVPEKEVEQAPQSAIPKEPVYGLPVRLKIPKIKVDTNILYMGLTKNGYMEVPEKIQDLGWYKNGPHPGMKGSAVIAGHLGVGRPGVFVNLDKLEKGDRFSVTDNNNKIISFIVTKTKTYNPNERPKEVFFNEDGYHLNLITCAGDWDKANQGMTKRLVVFSERI